MGFASAPLVVDGPQVDTFAAMGASGARREPGAGGAQRLDVGGGVAISYRLVGPLTGAAPTLLMTHGFAASAHMFDANARALAPDHRVITWDLRGHGASDAPDDPAAY